MWILFIMLAALKWILVLFMFCIWGELRHWARAMWWCLLAWYHEIPDYRDVPYTPIAIHTMEFPEEQCIATTYEVRCFPGEQFTVLQTEDQNLLPTAETIREIIATKSDDDLSGLEITHAVVDVDPVHCMMINIQSTIRQFLGPCNCHIDASYECSKHTRAMTPQQLLSVLCRYWLRTISKDDNIDVNMEMDVLDITVHIRNKQTKRLRQFNSLEFMVDSTICTTTLCTN